MSKFDCTALVRTTVLLIPDVTLYSRSGIVVTSCQLANTPRRKKVIHKKKIPQNAKKLVKNPDGFSVYEVERGGRGGGGGRQGGGVTNKTLDGS